MLGPPFGFLPPVSRYRLTLRREEGGPQQPDDTHLLTQGCSAAPPHVQVDSALVTWPCGNWAAFSRPVTSLTAALARIQSVSLTDSQTQKTDLWSPKGKTREGN